jgi:hypothetical protein
MSARHDMFHVYEPLGWCSKTRIVCLFIRIRIRTCIRISCVSVLCFVKKIQSFDQQNVS